MTPKPYQIETEANGALSLACQRAAPYVAAARAAGTRDVYARAFARWAEWCTACTPLLAGRAREHRRLPRRACRAREIRRHHQGRAGGHPLRPSRAGAPDRYQGAGDRHRDGRASPGAPVAPSGVRPRSSSTACASIIAGIEGDDVRALRDRALLLVGFFGALRRSELVALDVKGRSYVEIRSEGLILHLTATKASAATQSVCIPRRTDELCATRALEQYLATRRHHARAAVPRGEQGGAPARAPARCDERAPHPQSARRRSAVLAALVARRLHHQCGQGPRARARDPAHQPSQVGRSTTRLHPRRRHLCRLRRPPPVDCLLASPSIPIFLSMTLREDMSVAKPRADASDLEERRRDACRALGIDPSAIVWPTPETSGAPSASVATDREGIELSDEDWVLVAPFLPPEAPQANSMSNRDFLEAVLAVMRRGGSWSSRHTPAAEIEGVRRRFGRWAHQGVFQALADALPSLALSPECKRLLALAGQRAAQLKAPSRTFIATNSGPLSDRMCSGGPWVTNRSVRQWSTSSDLSRCATTIARQRRVNSSITTSMRKRAAVLRAVLHEVVRPDVIGPLGSQAHARAVIEPQTAPFGLLLWHFQPFPPPDAIDPLDVHPPALVDQQLGGCAGSRSGRTVSPAARSPPSGPLRLSATLRMSASASSAAGRRPSTRDAPRR